MSSLPEPLPPSRKSDSIALLEKSPNFCVEEDPCRGIETDCLRFISIVFVVLHHSAYQSNDSVLYHWTAFDLMLVILGAALAARAADRQPSWISHADFLKHKFKRVLLPVYLFSVFQRVWYAFFRYPAWLVYEEDHQFLLLGELAFLRGFLAIYLSMPLIRWMSANISSTPAHYATLAVVTLALGEANRALEYRFHTPPSNLFGVPYSFTNVCYYPIYFSFLYRLPDVPPHQFWLLFCVLLGFFAALEARHYYRGESLFPQKYASPMSDTYGAYGLLCAMLFYDVRRHYAAVFEFFCLTEVASFTSKNLLKVFLWQMFLYEFFNDDTPPLVCFLLLLCISILFASMQCAAVRKAASFLPKKVERHLVAMLGMRDKEEEEEDGPSLPHSEEVKAPHDLTAGQGPIRTTNSAAIKLSKLYPYPFSLSPSRAPGWRGAYHHHHYTFFFSFLFFSRTTGARLGAVACVVQEAKWRRYSAVLPFGKIFFFSPSYASPSSSILWRAYRMEVPDSRQRNTLLLLRLLGEGRPAKPPSKAAVAALVQRGVEAAASLPARGRAVVVDRGGGAPQTVVSLLPPLVRSGDVHSLSRLLLSKDAGVRVRERVNFNLLDDRGRNAFQCACEPHLSDGETEALITIMVRRSELFPTDELDWEMIYPNFLAAAASYQKLSLAYRLVRDLAFFGDATEPLDLPVRRVWRWDWERLLAGVGCAPTRLRLRSRRPMGANDLDEALAPPFSLCGAGWNVARFVAPWHGAAPSFTLGDAPTAELLRLCCWAAPWHQGETDDGVDPTELLIEVPPAAPLKGEAAVVRRVQQLVRSCGANVLFRDPTGVTDHAVLLSRLVQDPTAPLDIIAACLQTPMAIDFTAPQGVMNDFLLLYMSQWTDPQRLAAGLHLVLDRLEAHGHPPANQPGVRPAAAAGDDARDTVDWLQSNLSGDNVFSYPALHGRLHLVWRILEDRHAHYFFSEGSPSMVPIPRPVRPQDWEQLSRDARRRLRPSNYKRSVRLAPATPPPPRTKRKKSAAATVRRQVLQKRCWIVAAALLVTCCWALWRLLWSVRALLQSSIAAGIEGDHHRGHRAIVDVTRDGRRKNNNTKQQKDEQKFFRFFSSFLFGKRNPIRSL
eukprot:gene11317-7849_t